MDLPGYSRLKSFFVTLVILVPFALSAQTVGMHLTNWTPQETVKGNAGNQSFTATTGLLKFSVDAVVPTPFVPWPLELELFCVELAQQVSYNTINSFQVLAAHEAAKGVATGKSANISLAGIGTARARNLEILYHNVFGSTYDPLNLSNNDRVSFQIAVWELSHDDDFTLNTVGTRPKFWVTSPTNSIRNKAQQLVNGVQAVTGDANASRMALSVLHNGSVQDFLLPNHSFSLIPEPSAYAVLIGSVAALAAIFRRRVS